MFYWCQMILKATSTMKISSQMAISLENPRGGPSISLNPGGTQYTVHEVEESSPELEPESEPEPERTVMSEEEKENDGDSTVSVTDLQCLNSSEAHVLVPFRGLPGREGAAGYHH